jgi:hypothetical protein
LFLRRAAAFQRTFIMALLSARGAGFDIAATFGTTTNVVSATNVASAVVTLSAGHGLVVGDFVEIISGSGWQRAEGRVFRASVVAADVITFEGFDTTNTSLFPSGGFAGGSVRRIVTWTALSQVQNLELTGGEVQFTDVTGIGDLIGKQFPTIRSPITANLPIFYDPSLAWLATARTASNENQIRALRVRGPSGMRLLINGYVSFLDTPTIEGDVLRGVLSFSSVNVPTVYAS